MIWMVYWNESVIHHLSLFNHICDEDIYLRIEFTVIFIWVADLVKFHDDALLWRRFLHYWYFVREIRRVLLDSPNQGPVMWSFVVFFVVFQFKPLHKQSSVRWLETPWRSWYAIVMINVWDYHVFMMTSSNRSIFRDTGPLWRESTGDRGIPLTKASDAELWCFFWSTPEQTAEQTMEMAVVM